MKKETILIAVVALLAGLIIGWMVFQKSSLPTSAVAPAPGTGSAPMVNTQQRIDKIKAVVASEPNNRSAWVALGNEYFDADRPVESVEAYQKALDLNGNDPNVLTDQGVMFRRLGWYDRAIDNFMKANQIDPNHVNSLFNLGIVYRYDVNDFARATEVWNRFLQINPTGPGADRARQELEFLNSHPPIGKP
jgi:cytochrome c-type biogenesis protein CcmH/NrfG